MAGQLPVARYVDGVLAGDRSVLARAITLVESRNLSHRGVAQQVIQQLLPAAGGSHRVGITGAYGTETRAMTRAAYDSEARATGDPSWLEGDLTVPGPGLLAALGLRLH